MLIVFAMEDAATVPGEKLTCACVRTALFAPEAPAPAVAVAVARLEVELLGMTVELCGRSCVWISLSQK